MSRVWHVLVMHRGLHVATGEPDPEPASPEPQLYSQVVSFVGQSATVG